jgi:hypothetical protein
MRQGFLADWGLAIDLHKKESGKFEESKLHSYTVSDASCCCVIFLKSDKGMAHPYHSTELMFNADVHSVEHRACDDLESFFWILWLMSINYDGPFNLPRDWADIERLVTKLTAEEDHSTVDLHDTELSQPVQLPVREKESMSQIGTRCQLVPGHTPWMEAMFATTTAIPTPMTTMTTAPPPISTSTSNLTPVETVAQRLHKGLQGQQKFVSNMWTQQLTGDKNLEACLYHQLGIFASLNVPAWAKLPGSHAMSYRQIAMEKAAMSWEMMKALITPYFAKPPFLEGMERLHSLFKGTISTTREGKVFWSPPKLVPTHGNVTLILGEMLENMKGHDTYPDALQIQDGRQRYEEFLRHGRFPPFVLPTASDEEQKEEDYEGSSSGESEYST